MELFVVVVGSILLIMSVVVGIHTKHIGLFCWCTFIGIILFFVWHFLIIFFVGALVLYQFLDWLYNCILYK